MGRVEVCVDGTWGSICYRHFTDNDAQVVCRHLGYTALGRLIFLVIILIVKIL